jgi:hypothetical protein
MSMYHFDEGAFELAAGFEDKSLHVFQKPVEGGQVLMTIIREAKGADVTLDVIGEKFVEQMSSTLRRFELVTHERGTTGSLPAVRVRFRWFNPEAGPVYQEQIFVEYHELVVTFALACPDRVSEAAAVEFSRMVQSVKFRKRGA